MSVFVTTSAAAPSPATQRLDATTMDQRSPPEFMLDAFADPASVRDVVKGILHTIFFHRFFPALTPRTRDVLDLTLPHVDDVELETLIDQRLRHLDAAPADGRGQVTVQFFERRRRKAWLVGRGGDDEVCWETWTVRVTVAEPRTESERAKVRKAMEQTLLTTVMKIVTHANAHKDHIPPITAQGANPFPYTISVNQKESGGWASRMGIY
ncbi:Autophagy-related protein like [Verticillium longisporum]|uniref:Autophagy-related protein 101 n=3 Tax=Verticillium TaxID=1036719 RepID=G2X705_VERDV|nr:uncharacterized protein VDAG_05937 [Verticillium dahliae VdLs.17]KAF3345942.1 hypothetical protein VdG2_06178 [Verticillium dahliae VDG2]KAG7142842.1 Autophagy-related protein like [Verticillium longisporum]KAH6708162.1 hypothetical protein EV126DRAFT_408183 [Verticillium dahliae]EGY14773.1 hypothetical protein VDAG_05937 [Verticillium dahliae VdLs.17]PNH35219.1 hypothetical protein BJF96_g1627 [Verticillium dahliae]